MKQMLHPLAYTTFHYQPWEFTGVKLAAR